MNQSQLDAYLDMPALAGLDAADTAGIRELLKTPAKGEFFFLLQVIGKSPTLIWKAMVTEALRRFDSGPDGGVRTAQPSAVLDWEGLRHAVVCSAESADTEASAKFWHRMRYLVDALPKHEGVADGEIRRSAANRPRQEWRYATCRHCWRRVAYDSGLYRKTAGYCFLHNLPAPHPVYRKHSRLARSVQGEQQKVSTELTTLLAGLPSGTEVVDFLFATLTSSEGCLPHLAQYLEETGHDGTPEGLLWAFHGPVDAISDSAYATALGRYIRYVVEAQAASGPHASQCIFSYDELSRAEAWLTVLGGEGKRRYPTGASGEIL